MKPSRGRLRILYPDGGGAEGAQLLAHDLVAKRRKGGERERERQRVKVSPWADQIRLLACILAGCSKSKRQQRKRLQYAVFWSDQFERRAEKTNTHRRSLDGVQLQDVHDDEADCD